MKKLTLAAILASVLATTGAFADDLKLVFVPNHHGARIPMYQQVDQPSTVAIYSNGKGVGQRYQQDSMQSPQLRLVFRSNHHGAERAMYVAE